MLNYDKPTRIFPCILLIRNHMIFSRAIWNKQALVNFFRARKARAILLVFKKFNCVYLFQIALEIM